MLEASSHKPADAGSSNLVLALSRTFDAPRSLVFEAWTKAEHIARWFAPRPLTTKACEVDFRPGGVFCLTMRAPDGVEYPFEGSFREIVDGERIVFVGLVHGDNWTETTITFSDDGARTKVDVRQTYSHESDATRGAPVGWNATLDQLGEEAARLAAARPR